MITNDSHTGFGSGRKKIGEPNFTKAALKARNLELVRQQGIVWEENTKLKAINQELLEALKNMHAKALKGQLKTLGDLNEAEAAINKVGLRYTAEGWVAA